MADNQQPHRLGATINLLSLPMGPFEVTNKECVARFEKARYLELGGEQVYVVEYGCQDPVAVVLLCGPFPSDRLFSLGTWVKWGRFLARNGIGALRFDYRGTGESTGRFSSMDFTKWLEDVCELSLWVSGRVGGVPLALHGMGMGALLAQKAFNLGLGNSLLMWSAPSKGADILRQSLMVRLSMDMVLYPPAQRKTAQQYTAELEGGGTLEVDGYLWSAGLWASAERLALDEEYVSPGQGFDQGGRPWQHLALGENMAPLVRSARVLRAMNPRAAIGPDTPLNPDFTEFFERNASWLRGCVEKRHRPTRHA